MKEEVYMELPQGYLSTDNGFVAQLRRSLYGLKQAFREFLPKSV